MAEPLQFDIPNRDIIVPSPDTEVTCQYLYDQCQDWSDEPAQLWLPTMIRGSGKQNLGGGVLVGLTIELLDGWRVKFEDRAGPTTVQCNVTGGNLVAYDALGVQQNPITPSTYTQVVITASSSATLLEQEAIQYSSYGGGVTVDLTSSYSGTDFPVGTPQEPVNNFTDALSIASERGFMTLFILGDALVDSGIDYSDMRFVGQGPNLTTLTLDPAATLLDCEFNDATITGTLDGHCTITECVVDDLTFITGIIEESYLVGEIQLGGPDLAMFADCSSYVAGTATPAINMNGSGTPLAIRNYNGGIEIKNRTGTDAVSIDMNSGQVVIDSTVTNGTITIRGNAKVTDNSTGSAVINVDDLLQPSHVEEIHKAVATRKDIDFTGDDALGWQEVLYDENGAEVSRMDLYDETGSRITGTVSDFITNKQMISRRVPS